MSKQIFCAQCGVEVLSYRKALPSQERIIDVVEPHSCRNFDECEFWPLPEEKTGVCGAGAEISGGICTFEYSKSCKLAIETREKKTELVPIEKEEPTNIDKIFDNFKFVQKLNKLNHTKEEPKETGDKRDKEFLRKEIKTSSAPPGLLSYIDKAPNSPPENEGNGYE